MSVMFAKVHIIRGTGHACRFPAKIQPPWRRGSEVAALAKGNQLARRGKGFTSYRVFLKSLKNMENSFCCLALLYF